MICTATETKFWINSTEDLLSFRNVPLWGTARESTRFPTLVCGGRTDVTFFDDTRGDGLVVIGRWWRPLACVEPVWTGAVMSTGVRWTRVDRSCDVHWRALNQCDMVLRCRAKWRSYRWRVLKEDGSHRVMLRRLALVRPVGDSWVRRLIVESDVRMTSEAMSTGECSSVDMPLRCRAKWRNYLWRVLIEDESHQIMLHVLALVSPVVDWLNDA